MAHEKGVIINELGQRRDEIDMKLGEAATANAYPNQSYGRSIGGSRDIVSCLTREDCLEFVREYYRGGNISLAITGPASADTLIAEASKHFSSIIEGQSPALDLPSFHSGENRIDAGDWLNQVYTSISMPFTHGSFDENEPLLYMLMQSMWHQVHDRLRERSNLSYGVITQLNQFKKGGLFTIRGCTNPNTADEFLDSISSTFRTAHQLGDMSEEIFEGMKASLLAYYGRLPTQGASLCDEVLYYLRKPDAEFDLRAIVGQIKTLTLEDVREYAPQAIDPNRISFLSMGPRTDFMSYDAICGLFSNSGSNPRPVSHPSLDV